MVFNQLKKLLDARKMSINELEDALGYSKNTLYRLKTQRPGADKLEAIADYFNVTTDYLLGRESISETLTKKDTNDIADYMSKLREDLANGEGIHFYGEPMDDEDVQIILRQLELGAELAIRHKKKKMESD